MLRLPLLQRPYNYYYYYSCYGDELGGYNYPYMCCFGNDLHCYALRGNDQWHYYFGYSPHRNDLYCYDLSHYALLWHCFGNYCPTVKPQEQATHHKIVVVASMAAQRIDCSTPCPCGQHHFVAQQMMRMMMMRGLQLRWSSL